MSAIQKYKKPAPKRATVLEPETICGLLKLYDIEIDKVVFFGNTFRGVIHAQIQTINLDKESILSDLQNRIVDHENFRYIHFDKQEDHYFLSKLCSLFKVDKRIKDDFVVVWV